MVDCFILIVLVRLVIGSGLFCSWVRIISWFGVVNVCSVDVICVVVWEFNGVDG